MSGRVAERLYDLLPAVYRLRDSAQGEQLRALLGIMETELLALQADIGGLYENWFVETCDEWVVPYIGDLLRVQPLHSIGPGTFSQRAYVAHTLSYRRRKGTAAMLEQLARDVTGWPAHVVEFFDLLGTTQYLNHLRPGNLRTPDLRDTNQLELLGGPFEHIAHTADVRHISSLRGKYNIPSLGLFLWRLQDYAVTRGTGRPFADPSDGRYWFHPLGYDVPLFNLPQTKAEITRLADEINVPGPLRRRPLYDELESRRQATVDGKTTSDVYFSIQPVFEIFVDGSPNPIPPEQILICDLSDPQPDGWRRPLTTKTYIKRDGTKVDVPIKVAVDPAIGRLAFPVDVKPTQVEVSYTYAFSGDVGGGPYNRHDSVAGWLDAGRPVTWQVGVTQDSKALAEDQASGAKQLVGSLQDAITAWNTTGSAQDGAVGLITIMDSSTYHEDLLGNYRVQIPVGCKLAIVSADWPEEAVPNGIGLERIVGRLVPDGLRPHLKGSISVVGTGLSDNLKPGELVLDGLLVEGALTVLVGNLGGLLVSHCTLVPDKGGLTVNPSGTPGKQNDLLTIVLKRSICGPSAVPDRVVEVNILDSVIDAAADGNVAYAAPDAISAGAPLRIEGSTIIGKVHTVMMQLATNSIFTARLADNDSWAAPVQVDRRQEGCARFCYLPAGSTSPRRYRCQPDLALKDLSDPAARELALARLTPLFASRTYGQPSYAQLSLGCAEEIRTGSDDGSEMGCFSFLKQPQREANLRAAVSEYLRFGLEAGFYFIT